MMLQEFSPLSIRYQYPWYTTTWVILLQDNVFPHSCLENHNAALQRAKEAEQHVVALQATCIALQVCVVCSSPRIPMQSTHHTRPAWTRSTWHQYPVKKRSHGSTKRSSTSSMASSVRIQRPTTVPNNAHQRAPY